jgi:hypothetical protein
VNGIAVAGDRANTGVFALHQCNRLLLAHSCGNGKVEAIAALVRSILGIGQPLRDKCRLMLGRPKAAGRPEP